MDDITNKCESVARQIDIITVATGMVKHRVVIGAFVSGDGNLTWLLDPLRCKTARNQVADFDHYDVG